MGIKNLVTYLLTYLHNNNNNNNNIIKSPESHTSFLVYDKKKWIEFKHILAVEGTNYNRLFWCVAEIILEQFDKKENTLDKFLDELETVQPMIDAEPEKVLKYLQSLKMDQVKELEEKFMRNYIYTKAITQGEIELENFPYLWRKYK